MNTRKKRFLLIGTLITILLSILLSIFSKKLPLQIRDNSHGAEIYYTGSEHPVEISYEDLQQIRQLFNGRPNTKKFLHDTPDFFIYIPPQSGKGWPPSFSFCLDRQLIFPGDRLDATDPSIEDTKFICYTFTDEEKEQLLQIIRKYPPPTDKSPRH